MNDDERAAEYVVGWLDPDARRELEHALETDEALRQRVDDWVSHLAGLEPEGGAAVVPDRLWSAISERISDIFPAGTRTVGARDGEWLAIAPGLACKILHVDRAEGIQCYLLRLEPGAVIPAHVHRVDEECVVLEGELGIGELRVRPGEFHLARASSTHPAIHAQVPTVIYLRGEIRALSSDRPGRTD